MTVDFKTGGVACELAFIIGFIDGTVRAMHMPGGDEDFNASVMMSKMKCMGWRGDPSCLQTDVHVETGGRHDSYLLSQSKLHDRLAAVQEG